MKITPVLVVEEIERSLPFWVERMGFSKAVEVPEGDRLGFVILTRDGAELMLQTLTSVRNDTPQLAPQGRANDASLFIEVDNFEDVLRRLQTYEILLPERVAFYGMREIGVREPNGYAVIFAARAAA
jgi:catechol 2,3-dioxygenase-like lactoylglutathione lyase family enzyme